MLKTMLKPVMKRFFGLFISMAFISMLSIGILTAFASTVSNLKKTFKTYLKGNGDVNVIASTGFVKRTDLEGVKSLDCVDEVQCRLTIDAYLKRSDERTITARLYTFKEDGSSMFQRYIIESGEKSKDKVNVSVIRKFAENNGFKVGDSIGIGYLGLFVPCYINEIIETPEAIQARVNNYIWSDNRDFGYVYVSETEIDRIINKLADLIEEKITSDDVFREYYEKAVNAVGSTFPDIVAERVSSYSTAFSNQLLVRSAEGYTEEEVAEAVKGYLDAAEIKVKSVDENHKMFYYLYIENAIKQLRVAMIFLPVFFYAVTMIIIALFVNQIIKVMTSQIGVMMSIGVGKKEIMSIFSMFTFIMSVVAGIGGVGVGAWLNGMLAGVMIKAYSMPTIPSTVNPWIAAAAVLSLVIFAQAATVISCRGIFRITPKDATISNESKRKKLSPKLDAFIEKAPMNIKLGVNSIAQNPRRFFVSTFSVFAAFVIILLSLFFNVSKTELMHQTVDSRLSFDAQVYLDSVADDALIDEVRNDSSVKQMIDCYYTYADISDLSGGTHTYIECLAYDESIENDMIVIPSKNGKGSLKIQSEGIILPKTVAKTLKVKAGDRVKVNGKTVKVTDISNQYFHPVTYMSKTQLQAFSDNYVSSLLVNVQSEDEFLEFMSGKNSSYTVFTSSLSADIHGLFDSINVFIYIMIGFSLAMAFIILAIMSQNALLEQRRQLSVLRAIGFTITDISNIWTLQSVLEMLLSSLIAIPAGALVSAILFALCSSSSQIYPFIFSIPTVLFSLGFILTIIISCHLITMFSIKRWNLADNTRSRE